MERRTFGENLHALVSPLLEQRGFLAAFTERTGGVSSGPYASLNLGSHTGDRAADVEENRAHVARALGTPPLLPARQVHGATVIDVADASGHDLAEGDALTTTARGVPLAVLVADCVPLALASAADERVAVAHVGWRGAAAGVVQAALSRFPNPREVAAAIGPGIGPCHYEVGEETVGAVDAGTGGAAVARHAGSRPRLDLGATVEALLRAHGVGEIDRADLCVACSPDRFFSHRREGRTGRQAVVAMRM